MVDDGTTTPEPATAATPGATPSEVPEPTFVVKEDELAGLTPEGRKVVEARLKTYEKGWTAKTMELAEVRKATESTQAEARRQVEESQKLAQELRESMKALEGSIDGNGSPKAPEASPLDDIDPGDVSAIKAIVAAELAPMQQLMGGLASRVLDAGTSSSVDDFLKQPGNEPLAPFRDAVVQFYRDKGGTPDDLPVDFVFKSLHYEALKASVDEARKSGQLSALEGVANAQRRSVPGGPAQPIELTPGKNLAETWQNAKRVLSKVEQT